MSGSITGASTFKYTDDGSLLLDAEPGATTLYLPGEQITLTTAASTLSGIRYFLCVPRTLSTTLTSRVAVPASGRDDHRSCACGSRSS